MDRIASPALSIAFGLVALFVANLPVTAAPLPQADLDLAPDAPIIRVCHWGYHHFSGRPCGYGYRHRGYRPPIYGPPRAYGRQVCRWRHDEWGRPIQVCRWR